jgi:ENTH domain
MNGDKYTKYSRSSQNFNDKALVLLEFLIKHGSERVVDDARGHISTIKILRNFHFIDNQGKDQGINGLRLPLSSSAQLMRLLT